MLPVTDCFGNLIGSQRTNLHLTSVRGVVISGNDIHSGHQAGDRVEARGAGGGRKRGVPGILDQRLTVPRDLNELKVPAHLWVHSKYRDGHVEPGLASRDRAIRWKKATDNHLEPSSSVESSSKARAMANALRLRAR